MEGFERGLLSPEDTGGLEVQFGDAPVMVDLVEKIAHREGFGALLAEGAYRAAQKIGRGTEQYVVHVKGQEVPMHDPRVKFALGVGYATSPTGADHMHNIHDTQYENDAVMEQLAMLGIHERALAFNDLSPKKVRLAAYEIPWKVFQNCLGICMFVPHGRVQTIDTINAVTGWNTNLFEVMKAGERALAMARVFNARAGFTAADDRQPERFAEPLGSGAHQGSHIPDKLMEEAVALYYQMLGWDMETGAPTVAKLYELGLDWLVKEA
jgi:aldehyde:ferredoxin oxidoreductase